VTLSDDAVEALADRLHGAYRDARPTTTPSETHDLTLKDAYRVQRAAVERRGEPVVGYKLGFTNEAVQSEVGVDEPASGRLTADTVSDDPTVEVDGFVSPRAEPEIGFVLDRLEPPAGVHDVLAATRAIVPAIEVVDSRTGGWSPTPEDAVADNALAAAVRVGPTASAIEGRDLSMEAVQVRKNGRLVETGVGANALGHPTRAVRWLANRRTIEAGSLVLTGSLTPTVALAAGDAIEVRFSTLGSVSLRVDHSSV
jgi:2-keto-4-pentenoate hydratase